MNRWRVGFGLGLVVVAVAYVAWVVPMDGVADLREAWVVTVLVVPGVLLAGWGVASLTWRGVARLFGRLRRWWRDRHGGRKASQGKE